MRENAAGPRNCVFFSCLFQGVQPRPLLRHSPNRVRVDSVLTFAFFVVAVPCHARKFQNENGEVAMSKLTLSALEDIGYIVDPSKVRPKLATIRSHFQIFACCSVGVGSLFVPSRVYFIGNTKPLFLLCSVLFNSDVCSEAFAELKAPPHLLGTLFKLRCF